MKKNFTRLFLSLFLLFSLNASVRAQSGNALDYTTDDYLELPDDIVGSITGDFTIEAWVFYKGGTQWGRIFDIGTGLGTDAYIYLAASSNPDDKVVFGFKIPGYPERRVVGLAIAENTWTHIAVTVDYSNPADPIARLFVNGTFIALNGMRDVGDLTPYYLSDLGTTDNNWLGRSRFVIDPYFNGAIDEFRISNIVRYPGAGGFTPATTFTTDANTVALYHFDEGTGQFTADATGNNADAVLGSTTGVDTNDPTWRVATTLPVYILQFSAQKVANEVVVKWKVYSTGEGGRFIVERGTDGSNFHAIGTLNIPATQGTFSFDFVDRSFAGGKNYYRLKVLENNASAKYSSVVSVDAPGLYTAFPTATTSHLFVRIPAATNIAIYSANGMLVKKMQLASSQNIDVTNLQKGAYQLVFEGSAEVIRFVKL